MQAVKEGMPVQKAAKRYSIARTTMNNNLAHAKKESAAKFEPYSKHSQIFNQEQESSLANYLEKCSGMFHGLTTKNVRTLAYEMAFINQSAMWHYLNRGRLLAPSGRLMQSLRVWHGLPCLWQGESRRTPRSWGHMPL